MKPKANFLNVDLEIISASKLDPLISELGDRVIVLHHGRASKPRHRLLSLENARYSRNPNVVIHQLCALIENLPPTSLQLWQKASKTFDVGYQVLPSEVFTRFSLRPGTLQRVAALDASLTVTLYRGDRPDNEIKIRI